MYTPSWCSYYLSICRSFKRTVPAFVSDSEAKKYFGFECSEKFWNRCQCFSDKLIELVSLAFCETTVKSICALFSENRNLSWNWSTDTDIIAFVHEYVYCYRRDHEAHFIGTSVLKIITWIDCKAPQNNFWCVGSFWKISSKKYACFLFLWANTKDVPLNKHPCKGIHFRWKLWSFTAASYTCFWKGFLQLMFWASIGWSVDLKLRTEK